MKCHVCTFHHSRDFAVCPDCGASGDAVEKTAFVRWEVHERDGAFVVVDVKSGEVDFDAGLDRELAELVCGKFNTKVLGG